MAGRASAADWCSSPTTATCSTASRPRCSRSIAARPTSTFRRAGTPDPATRRTSPAAPNARSRPRPPSRCARTWRRRELAWLRRGAPARTSKPKARIATATALVDGQAQAAAREGELGLSLGIEAAGLEGHRARRRRLLVAGRHARCSIRARWCSNPATASASSAPNGAGKTTLLDLIAGRLQPTTGQVDRGATVQIGYYDQLGRDLDLTQRVRDAVAGDKGEPSLADVNADAPVLVRRRRAVRADRHVERWRAPAPAAAADAGRAAERAAARRADQRSRPRHAARAGGLPRRLAGHRRVVSHDRAFLDRVTDELLALDGQRRRALDPRRRRRLARRSAPPRRPPPARLPQTDARSARGADSATKPASAAAARRRCAASSARPNATSRPRSPRATSLAAEIGSTNAHWELVDARRAAGRCPSQRSPPPRSSGWPSPPKPKPSASPPDARPRPAGSRRVFARTRVASKTAAGQAVRAGLA